MRQKPLIEVPIPEEEAVNYLINQGYVVFKPSQQENKVTNEDVIKVFYTRLHNELNTYACPDTKEELRQLTRYQRKAAKIGITKYKSNANLVFFINYIFDNLAELELTQVPYSLSFLLGAGSWIVNKALMLYTVKLSRFEESAEAELYKQKLYEQEDDKFIKLQKERHRKLLKE